MEKLLTAQNSWRVALGRLSKPSALRNCFITLAKQRHLQKTLQTAASPVPFGHFKCLNKNHDEQQSQPEHNFTLKELSAWMSMFRRSGYNTTASVTQLLHGDSRITWFKPSTSPSQQRQPGQPSNKGPNQENGNDNNGTDIQRLVWQMVIMGIMVGLLMTRVQVDDIEIDWNEFVNDFLARGEVSRLNVFEKDLRVEIILQPGARLKKRHVVNPSSMTVLTMKIDDVENFEEKLRVVERELGIPVGQGIPVIFRKDKKRDLSSYFLINLVMITLMFEMLRRNNAAGGMSNFMGNIRNARFVRADLQAMDGKGVTFKDVAGLHEAKVEVMEFVDYLKRPDRFKKLGAKIPRGAILTGPPGCGKTLLAKAVATEAKVPFLVMAGSEFVEMIGGVGASRVRDLFKTARQKAPCIIYIDEIDAIGKKRGAGPSNREEEQTLNQLLVEMDGIGTKGDVIMLGSTNRVDMLDKALLRPGRFDRHIDIGLPTLAERKEMFDMYLKKLSLEQTPDTYSERLSQLSPGMSGADIANVCNEAALHAARHTHKSVGQQDFDYAIERVVAGVAKKSRVLAAVEKRIVAYHEAGHAVVGWLLEHTDALLRVSIVQRTNAALGFAQYLPQDRYLHSQAELMERVCMALGGRAAENIIFNRVSSGAQDDLQRVTKMAYAQIRSLGMNENIGLMSFPSTDETGGAKPYSNYLENLMDEEAKNYIARAYQATEKLLRDNVDKLTVVAEELLKKEALSYEEVEQLIGPPPFPKNKVNAAGSTM